MPSATDTSGTAPQGAPSARTSPQEGQGGETVESTRTASTQQEPTISELVDLVKELRKENKSLRKSIDSQVGRLSMKTDEGLKALADAIGETAQTVVDSASDEDVRDRLAGRVTQVRSARQAMDVADANLAIAERRLSEANLSEEDLPHSLSWYAAKPQDVFEEAVKNAMSGKTNEKGGRAPAPANDEVAALKEEVAELKALIASQNGSNTVPVGNKGSGTKRHESPLDWTPEEMVAYRRGIQGRRGVVWDK